MKKLSIGKVFVALSGGVDSSVAAALLRDDGYDVTGVFVKCWSDTKDEDGRCTWREDYRDAFEVAKELGIKFRAVDFEKEYKEFVFAEFLKEYEASRTPNPDVVCNRIIKFNALMQYARSLGADWLATGHHVTKKTVTVRSGSQKGHVIYKIIAGKDKNKDQSYFLSQLNQAQLEHTLFPIGRFTKIQVRAMARKYGLKTADKKSTSGICFVGPGNFQEFLEKYIPRKPGEIVDVNGAVVGKHKGLAYYTIGQRYGLGIPTRTPTSEPYYVVDKDKANNCLIVDFGLYAASLMRSRIEVDNVHWISGVKPKLPLTCTSRIRYRQPLQKARLTVKAGRYNVSFAKPQRAVTPGQIVAFYKGSELLGSAIISS